MSKICLVEVGKCLGILKSQHWCKWFKIANGPHFLPRIIIQKLCTTHWPKGKLFYFFFNLLIEFLNLLIHLIQIKYEKILHATLQIFLCSISTHHNSKISCTLNMERIGNDWHDLHMEKIGKDTIKNQIFDSWLQRFWTCFANLKHSS